MRKLKKVQTDFRRCNADAATEWQCANSNVNGNGVGNSSFALITRSAPRGVTIGNFGKRSEFLNYYAGKTDENLPASTRLSAPIKRVLCPSVDAIKRADGRPRQILLCVTAFVSSSAITGQAREICPPTITASGLKPFSRFEIPRPR